MPRRKKKQKKQKEGLVKYLTRAKSTGGANIVNNNNNTQTTYNKPACHKGNTVIWTDPNTGANLYIGGWNNGATFDWNTHVIDLTGNEHRLWDIPVAYDDKSKEFLQFCTKSYAGWLSLPFPDYGTPKGMSTREQWEGMTEVIKGILANGNDVLVACLGGHGRSGLFVSIVGYMLNIDTDPTWASPVEKVRAIHCDEAIETYAQEKYVYDILGLRIQPKHVYDDDHLWYGRGTGTSSVNSTGSYTIASTFEECPICGTQSLYVAEYGMCMTCRNGFEAMAKGAIPEREDLTLDDIKTNGLVKHLCTDPKCMGIWKASKCGHITHNMIIYEGYCEACYKKYEDEVEYAERKLKEEKGPEWDDQPEYQSICALCGKDSVAANKNGICWECSSALVQNKLVDDVHNTITDPYKFIPHTHCEDEHMCVGIVRADNCQHVVHNREVEDGLCPACFELKSK